jgi:hypothetical protein
MTEEKTPQKARKAPKQVKFNRRQITELRGTQWQSGA